MEPVKADIIEYIGDYGEKYSLNISEMLSTEMIEKLNSGKEKLTEEESYKIDEVFIWFNEIQCRVHGVTCSKFIRRNSCNIAITFDNKSLMERFNFKQGNASYNLKNILTKMDILGMCKVEYIDFELGDKTKVIEYPFNIGMYTLHLMELIKGKVEIKLMLSTDTHDRRVKRIVGYLSGSNWR